MNGVHLLVLKSEFNSTDSLGSVNRLEESLGWLSSWGNLIPNDESIRSKSLNIVRRYGCASVG